MNKYLIAGFCFSLFTMLYCGSPSANSSSDQEAEDTGQEEDDLKIEVNGNEVDLSGLKDALSSLSDGKEVEIIEAKKLKEFLPETLAGLKRTEFSSEKSGIKGWKVSTAKAGYEEEGKRLDVVITDTGNLGGAFMGIANWAEVEIDRESNDGYERTTTIEGHKAIEKFDRNNQTGSLTLLIENRLILDIKGDKIEEKDFDKALKTIDIKGLSKLFD